MKTLESIIAKQVEKLHADIVKMSYDGASRDKCRNALESGYVAIAASDVTTAAVKECTKRQKETAAAAAAVAFKHGNLTAAAMRYTTAKAVATTTGVKVVENKTALVTVADVNKAHKTTYGAPAYTAASLAAIDYYLVSAMRADSNRKTVKYINAAISEIGLSARLSNSDVNGHGDDESRLSIAAYLHRFNGATATEKTAAAARAVIVDAAARKESGLAVFTVVPVSANTTIVERCIKALEIDDAREKHLDNVLKNPATTPAAKPAKKPAAKPAAKPAVE